MKKAECPDFQQLREKMKGWLRARLKRIINFYQRVPNANKQSDMRVQDSSNSPEQEVESNQTRQVSSLNHGGDPPENDMVTNLNYKNYIKNLEVNGEKKNSVSGESGTKSLECCDFETATLEAGYGKYNVLLLLASFPGLFGCNNTTGSISLILPSAECDLELTNFQMGLMNSMSYIGMITFAFFWGFLSDVFGRKKLLVIAFYLDVFFNVAVGLSQSFPFFITAKLFSGFVGSGPYALLMAYLAECHASKYRASILLWTGTFGAISSICLPAMAWLIIPQPIQVYILNGLISLPSWRIFLLVSAIPSLTAAILLSFFYESPKYLMSRGRNNEAMAILRKIYEINTGKPQETFPVKSLVEEAREFKGGFGKFVFVQQCLNQIKPLFQKPYSTHMFLIFSSQFLSLGGLNTMRLWAPQLFSVMLEKEKYSGSEYAPGTLCELLSPVISNNTQINDFIQCTEHLVEPRIYINSMVVGAVSSVGYLCSGYMVAILGKKYLITIVLVTAGLCGVGMYWSGTSDIMMALTSMFVTLISIGTTATVTVVVDLIPTAQRSMGVSLTMMFGRTGAMVGNLTFPLLLDWNCNVTIFLLAAILFGSGGISMLYPRTKGAALK